MSKLNKPIGWDWFFALNPVTTLSGKKVFLDHVLRPTKADGGFGEVYASDTQEVVDYNNGKFYRGVEQRSAR